MTSESTSDSATPAAFSAGGSPRAWAVLVGSLVASVVVDLATKYWAFASIAPDPVVIERSRIIELTRAQADLSAALPPHQPTVAVPGLLEFTLVLNKGAVFGLGAGGRWFFVAFTLIAIGFCLHVFTKWTTRRQWLTHASLGLVVGGGIGNLYDRLQYACVRDFLHPLPGVKYPFGISTPWSGAEIWPWVSNVADALLIIGIAGVMVHLLRPPPPELGGPAPKPKRDPGPAAGADPGPAAGSSPG